MNPFALPQGLTPAQRRWLRLFQVGGWILLLLAVGGAAGVMLAVKRQGEVSRADAAERHKAFVAQVRACRWRTRPPRSWDDCAAEIRGLAADDAGPEAR